MDVGSIRLEQQPDEGIATLSYDKHPWAFFTWRPLPDRRLGEEILNLVTQTKGAPGQQITEVDLEIKNPFPVDVVLDLAAEQLMADTTGNVTRVVDRLNFGGRRRSGRSTAPASRAPSPP